MSDFIYNPPERSTAFVAYTREPVEDADPNGQVRPFRSQTYIAEFPSIKVKEITEKSHGSGDREFTNLSVKFDAASAGIPNFSNDFGASLNAADPAADLLRTAHQRDLPIMLVKETARNFRNDDGKIDPHRTIADLRGAKPDNSAGTANDTRANCHNVVAGIGPAGNPAAFTVTGECTSDPSDWAALRGNKSGAFAPTAQWRAAEGGLIPNDAPTGGDGLVDMDALAQAVADRLAPVLAPTGRSAAAAPTSAQNMDRPAVRSTSAKVAEAKRWQPWNSDGSVNASSYLMTKERAVWTYALRKIVAVGYLDGAPEESATRLHKMLLWMTDKVQESAANRCERTDGSHFESSLWVQLVLDEVSVVPGCEKYRFRGEVLAERDTANAWMQAVVEKASQMQRDALARAEAYLEGDRTAAGVTPRSPQTPPQATPAGPAGEPAPATAEAPAAAPSPATQVPAAAVTGSARDHVGDWVAFLGRVATWAPGRLEVFDPLLAEEFGTVDMDAIDGTDFANFIAIWDKSNDTRRDFSEKAKEAAYAAGNLAGAA